MSITTSKEILEERKKELSEKDYKDLLKQINSEYDVALKYIEPKWDLWSTRLSLYSNQKKNPKAIGDPILFTIFQTVFAQLYNDTLSVSFSPREEGDEDKAETLTSLAEFDFSEMEKDQTDYQWIWDTMFFGRGIQLLMEFDSESKTPVQETIDPLRFLRDPTATSAQGTGKRKKGALSYCGWFGKITKAELDKNKELYFNTDKLFSDDDNLTTSNQGLSKVEENEQKRTLAQGLADVTNDVKNLFGDNRQNSTLNWITNYDGKLIYVTTTIDIKNVVRYEEIPYKNIPLIDRSLFPSSHDWDGVSIPDLVEDKQRARAVIQNLMLESAEFSLYNTYAYDSNKITNKNDLNREMNKHIGVDGSPVGVIAPIQRGTIGQEAQFILDLLNSSAQSSTATPYQAQGMPAKGGKTATENVLIDKKVDERRSLSAKIFGWSEKAWYKQWYNIYNEYFDDSVDTKIVRITGAFGNSFKKLSKGDFIGETSPDIVIESTEVSDAKRFNVLQSYATYVNTLAADPSANMRYATKRLGELRGIKQDEIARLLPKTVDERQAEVENVRIADNKVVKVTAGEDHQSHLEYHEKAKDTPAKWQHMKAHEAALLVKRDRPDLFEGEDEEVTKLNPMGGQRPEINEQPLAQGRQNQFI